MRIKACRAEFSLCFDIQKHNHIGAAYAVNGNAYALFGTVIQITESVKSCGIRFGYLNGNGLGRNAPIPCGRGSAYGVIGAGEAACHRRRGGIVAHICLIVVRINKGYGIPLIHIAGRRGAGRSSRQLRKGVNRSGLPAVNGNKIAERGRKRIGMPNYIYFFFEDLPIGLSARRRIYLIVGAVRSAYGGRYAYSVIAGVFGLEMITLIFDSLNSRCYIVYGKLSRNIGSKYHFVAFIYSRHIEIDALIGGVINKCGAVGCEIKRNLSLAYRPFP